MRIAVDIRPLLEKNRAGVSLYTLNLLQELAKNGAHEYALFCNSSRGNFPVDVPRGSTVSNHFSRYPNRLLNASFAFLHWPRLETLTAGADLVYLPNLNFVATGRPLVTTVHDLSFIRYPEYFSAKQRLWHRAINAERMIRRSSAVVAVSEHTKDDIMELYDLPAERIHVVSPAVGPEYFCRPPHEQTAVREKYNLPTKFILFLGMLEPRKNVTGLIEAFNQLDDDTDLVIAGSPGWKFRQIFAAADRSPKRKRIKFIGYVDETDKPALYSSAWAFAYPSHYEGFGMPVLEAMACGTPVVASHTSSLGEMVADAGLLVNPGKPDEIAFALQSLQDQRLHDRLHQSGIWRAQQFTWQKSARALENIF